MDGYRFVTLEHRPSPDDPSAHAKDGGMFNQGRPDLSPPPAKMRRLTRAAHRNQALLTPPLFHAI
jgi:hypothetical protein